MKALLILLLIYINSSLAANDTKYSLKIYPKKVKPGNIQLINAGKYKKHPKQLTKNRLNEGADYTVFPVQKSRRLDTPINTNVPQRLTLFEEENSNLKPRVKKVLPDYVWSLRRKRSALPDDAKPEVEMKVEVEQPKVEAATDNVASVTESPSTPKPVPKETSATTVKDKTKKDVTKSKSPLRSSAKHNKKKPKPARKGPAKVEKKTTKKPAPKARSGKKTQNAKKGPAKPKQAKVARGGKSKGKKQNKRKVMSRRLIAARDALIEDYPYVVSIQKDSQHWCAGALLNPRLIITTANCMWKANRMSRLEVRAGSRHADYGGQLANIAEVIKHPNWGIRKAPDNDVALALLDRNLRFSDNIHGVDLPNRVMLPAFDDVWVTSWGAIRRDGIYDPQPTTLQVYHARLMDHGRCNNVTHRFGISVTKNFICLSQTGKRAPCTRDTGSPAVSDGILWGLASWGIRKLCGTERFPAMFSYLASHSNMDFIMNATHYLMADERFYPFQDRFPYVRTIKGSFTPALAPA